MEIDYYTKKKILAISKDEVKRQFNNPQGSLENFEDLFIDISPISCITGSRLILNDGYKGNRSE